MEVQKERIKHPIKQQHPKAQTSLLFEMRNFTFFQVQNGGI
jgi:hypothetical protein